MAAISLMTWAASTQDRMKAGLIQNITNESIFLKLLNFIPIDGFNYE